jgi:3-(3-hydroxy-phenyl)propionate hydroxylase
MRAVSPERYAYAPPSADALRAVEHHPVVIAGGGMVGLSLAIDLQRQGVPVVVLEKSDVTSEGSRALCHAKRTLEVWHRLGVGETVRESGVQWQIGRLFHRDQQVYSFDLLPEAGHRMPAFVNLQQDQVETLLHDRYGEIGGEIRHRHALQSIDVRPGGVQLTVTTPDGNYRMTADWLVSCEGVRSVARRALDLRFDGDVFSDKFLIVDVRFSGASFPPERWFWFKPPFHDGQTALLHRQADDVWRIDLQLDANADAEAERNPQAVRPRIARMLGRDDFEIVWVSVYAFQCRSLDRYVHGRVLFAGDSAHQVSPFGARGGAGGVQDADNLGWKLARVLHGRAPAALLDSYDAERRSAAAENILHSCRATRFMTPRTPLSRLLRDEVLALAAIAPFARALVNSGRLSRPAHLVDSDLNSADIDRWSTGQFAPGSPAVDAPLGGGAFLLDLLGDTFVSIVAEADVPTRMTVAGEEVRILALGRDLEDPTGLLTQRYDLSPGSMLVFRPDQHLISRRRTFSAPALKSAVLRALGRSGAP